jgi:hypothetical protein
MAVGIPVAELGVDLKRAYNIDEAAIWLSERGIWLRIAPFWSGYGEKLRDGRLYLVGIRSLNKIGTDHCVLLDTRGEHKVGDGFHERSHWKTYDPNRGRDDAKFIEWVDEHAAIDFAELHQRDSRFVCFGAPPLESAA